ncbi:MAG: acyl-CoA dehydrogenase family protein [Gemmatimonadota bacterium]|nr:acyl-CoA dehydrogenase family protein [Gemmatimonadota bacterium]MDE3128253.1 acyl-CoA dehydrogenase family protein [Gemmatimonadota bacterium]MDE3172955.1 acyl-CoA dehydrogenase family protein [Gemmatimonadota bacterium]MDE3215957.1 acyl-CoA dehydrogenase family protein [Gemmatimonadota bacterium]
MTATTAKDAGAPGAAAEAHLAAPDVNPSFTRGVFLGELNEDLIFPFPALSADERESLDAILDAFRSFAADHIDSAKMDHDARFPDDVRAGMHELGMMGVTIPEAYGGFGASAKVYTRIFGELGGTDPALAVYFGAHQSIGCKGIVLFGTEAQKRKYLPKCATGEMIAGFCLTEPGSGSDAQAMKSHAELSADGTHYVLNGQKMWISNAGYADIFTVFAKVAMDVDGKQKQRVTAFVVDAHAPGVRLGKLEEKMGIKASDTRGVFFENVKVPVEDRLGDVGQGFHVALEVLNSGRLGLAAGSARGTRRIMREAIKYANERQQFGKPIGAFEMIRKKIATNAVETYAADSAVQLTSGMMDRGGVDFSLETAACKIYASELAFRASNDAMQIAGGIGYSKEFPYEQAVRDSRINLIFEGTNEILRALIALMGLQQPGEKLKTLGKAFKDPIHSIGAISHYLSDRAKRQITKPSFTRVHEALRDEAELVAELVHNLALSVEAVIVKHGKGVIDRQYLQERMANAAIDIYLAAAVLSRVTWEIERAGGPDAEGARPHVDMARIFVPMAYRRARRNIRGLRHNQDHRVDAIAERSLETGELGLEAATDA